MSEIVLDGVTYIYGKNTPYESRALDNVNIKISSGKITGIIGHTGSGKSTLVQLLNGILSPDEGSVIIDRENIWEKPKEIRKYRFKVGLFMQYPEYQLFEETIRKDIAFGPSNMGLSEARIAERVAEAASFVGLETELLDKSPFDLSGGQKRRAAIAGIIAMRPDILVLDEPAAGLDPRGRRDILGGLAEYVKRGDTSIILVSHSMEDMAYYCDNVVVMNKAKVFKSGTVDEIFSDADPLSDIGLDVPSVAKIAARLRRAGYALDGRLYTVDGVRDAIARYVGEVGK